MKISELAMLPSRSGIEEMMAKMVVESGEKRGFLGKRREASL